MKPYPIAAALVVLLSGCDLTPQIPGAEKRAEATQAAKARQLKRACASASTYDRLKALAFDDALKVREANSPVLDRIASGTVLRMENPVVKSRDAELNVTVCSGRMILELPPGIEDAFGGKRRLEADIEYSAQEAIDGSGLVYEMRGAEPIVYRLAAIDLKRGGASDTMVAGAPGAIPNQEPAPLPVPVDVAAAPPPRLPPAQVVERPTVPRQPPVAPPARPAPKRVAVAEPRPIPKPAQVAARRPPEPAIRRDQPDPRQRVTARPSFNCRSARTRSERLVCSDGQLARQDREMSSVFYSALAGADGRQRAELRASRDRFLRYRDRCSSAECISRAYDDRVDEIRDIREDE